MYLRTLGRLKLDGSTLRRPKPLLLLAYLAIEGPKPRRHLADLFWMNARDPRDSLSTTIRRLNRGAELVRVHDDRIEALVACDATEFERRAREGAAARALDLYAGPFLEGIATPLREESEEWVYATRERLADQARRAHLDIAGAALQQGHHAAAARHAERTLDVESASPWERDDLDEALAILHQSGSPRARELERESERLGVPALHDGPDSGLPVRRRSNLPHRVTSFVGRDREVERIQEVFDAPMARLLTLHGAAGVGKSRLAVEAARTLYEAGRFMDGVYFVALESVTDPAAVPGAIAGALRLTLAPKASPGRQLVTRIDEKDMLLVLDNFEHLVGLSHLPSTLLRDCGRLRLLVTSRRTLNVDGEYVERVRGLPVSARPSGSEAVQLLHQRLEQRTPEQVPSAPDDGVANRICELLDGNPLAIELAAGLARTIPLHEIAEELEVGLHVLVDRHSAAPERHKSLRGALEVSWSLLRGEAQEALASSSAFRGGFRRRAAHAVGGLDVTALTELVDAAILRSLASGRFEHHPLVHQFAMEKLAERPDLEARVHTRHGRYYLKRLADLDHDLHGGATSAAVIGWIEDEFANLRQAWDWAIAHGEVELLGNATWALAHFAEFRGRYVDVIDLFARALQALRGSPGEDTDPWAVGRISSCFAFLCFRVGRIEEAIEVARVALSLLEPIRRPTANWGPWAALQALGMSYLSLTEPVMARGHLEAAVAGCLADREGADGDARAVRIADYSIATSFEAMAYLELHAGEFAAAVNLLQSAMKRLEPHQCPSLGYLYWTLGQTYLAMGQVHDARDSLDRGLAFSQATGFHMLIGHILNDQARVHLGLGDPQRADATCRDALAVAHDSGDKWLETSVLAAHGLAAAALGRADEARERFIRSLQVARSFKGYGFAFEALQGLADLWASEGGVARGASLLAFVRCSPLAPKAVAHAAGARLEALRTELDADVFRDCVRRGETMQVEEAFSPPDRVTNA